MVLDKMLWSSQSSIQIDQRLRRGFRAAEVEQPSMMPCIDELRCWIKVSESLKTRAVSHGSWVLSFSPILEALGARADRRKRIVDLVHDARGQRADRRELFRLREIAPPPGAIR
jgi:hypothetical protein